VRPPTEFEVFTLFPQVIDGYLGSGLLARAVEGGLLSVRCTSYRDFATDRHRSVDDAPFGGGAGMLLRVDVVVSALEHVTAARGPMHRLLLTPAAPLLDQRVVERLAQLPRVALLCGRYEGFDARVGEHFVDECRSIGDFVLAGGELAALVVVEAVARLVAGVLGNPESAARESFARDGLGALVEHPHYTRPALFRGLGVPAVLKSGDHAEIDKWRKKEARLLTWHLRPELRRAPSLGADAVVLAAVSSRDPHREALVRELSRAADDGQITRVLVLGAREDRGAALAAVEPGMGVLAALRAELEVTGHAAPVVVGLLNLDGRPEASPEARSRAASAIADLCSSSGQVQGRRKPAAILVLGSLAESALAGREDPRDGLDAAYAQDFSLVREGARVQPWRSPEREVGLLVQVARQLKAMLPARESGS
jgi:tRNA (guanine37-N1)-methyltransferase